ncbi:hypothetical protein TPE_1823 [Treponema pedis str. T A4]|uniref:Uncharacterized protein n=1 Tax=Treponema pedis str. T A4 TaxID=1291379 RepID=S5ZNV5_9SPIR|nr:hypothetical protein TPE_1823 [Treponema pedis str. T A4]
MDTKELIIILPVGEKIKTVQWNCAMNFHGKLNKVFFDF